MAEEVLRLVIAVAVMWIGIYIVSKRDNRKK
jgi:hypothetical protein